MLRPADVHLGFEPLSGNRGLLFLDLGPEKRWMRPSSQFEFRALLRFRSGNRAPQRLAKVEQSVAWMFQEAYFWDDGGLTQTQVHREIAWGNAAA